jgi:hypothetical protein
MVFLCLVLEVVNITYKGKPAGQVFLSLSVKFPGQQGGFGGR